MQGSNKNKNFYPAPLPTSILRGSRIQRNSPKIYAWCETKLSMYGTLLQDNFLSKIPKKTKLECDQKIDKKHLQQNPQGSFLIINLIGESIFKTKVIIIPPKCTCKNLKMRIQSWLCSQMMWSAGYWPIEKSTYSIM